MEALDVLLEQWKRTGFSAAEVFQYAHFVQTVEEVEAGDVLQIDQRDVEEAVGDETDGQGTELKSKRILIVKVVKKEETEEELENTDICIERPKSAKELYNGESESLPVANSAEQWHEVVMTPKVVRRTSWMNCCGLLDVITGSGT
ncbi:hypothetical protein NL676_010906 [Syzygium grande]|nr:hypothetical protein NL676_010906 [Syzygium grande]